MAHRQAVGPLVQAIKRGDLGTVEALLDENPGLANARTDQGESPVLVAAYYQQAGALRLLAAHARLDVFEAAVVGRADRLDELLLADPALARTRSGDGWTALHLATFFGQPVAVERLLHHAADVNARSENAQANTPLHAALAGRAEPAVVDRLLQAGADVNARAAQGVTPLHVAVSRGSTDLVRTLLARGADPTATMDDGQTPAAIAATRGHPDVSELLSDGWSA